ncbi:MAG: TetR/AcrR family transcriptional regulator [Bacteroidota bacterium]
MPRNKQFSREEVLERAVQLFWYKGFHATSISDLVEYLGINRASLYNAFGDKETLFQEALTLYQEQGQEMMKGLEAELAQGTVRAFFETFLFQQLDEILSDQQSKGCFVVNSVTELANRSNEIRQLSSSNLAHSIGFFTRIITLGQQKGEINRATAPEVLAHHFFTFFNGLQVIGKIDKDEEKLRKVILYHLNNLFSA